MKINNNIVALRGYNHLTKVNSMKEKSLEKLSTGKRINSASDDAAGMAISTKMNNQIKGMQQALRNTQDGQSLVQTCEGALSETNDILSRMRELTVQANNGTYTSSERDNIKVELKELAAQITDIAKNTKFNGQELLTTSAAGNAIKLQVGANKGETLEVNTTDLQGVAKTLTDAIDLDDNTKIEATLTAIDTAIQTVSTDRATLGATINRLDYTASNLSTSIENLSAANSRIEDTDVAQEMITFTKNNILAQAGNSMLAQAMQMPNSALQLLG